MAMGERIVWHHLYIMPIWFLAMPQSPVHARAQAAKGYRDTLLPCPQTQKAPAAGLFVFCHQGPIPRRERPDALQ